MGRPWTSQHRVIIIVTDMLSSQRGKPYECSGGSRWSEELSWSSCWQAPHRLFLVFAFQIHSVYQDAGPSIADETTACGSYLLSSSELRLRDNQLYNRILFHSTKALSFSGGPAQTDDEAFSKLIKTSQHKAIDELYDLQSDWERSQRRWIGLVMIINYPSSKLVPMLITSAVSSMTAANLSIHLPNFESEIGSFLHWGIRSQLWIPPKET